MWSQNRVEFHKFQFRKKLKEFYPNVIVTLFTRQPQVFDNLFTKAFI